MNDPTPTPPLRPQQTIPLDSLPERPAQTMPLEAGGDAALAAWTEGWQALESTLATLVDVDLRRTVRIRGEPHTVAQALARSLAHAAYHQGQITLIARMLVSAADWKPISIPRGGTAAHHEAMGFSARRP
jgi:hypothetical protein